MAPQPNQTLGNNPAMPRTRTTRRRRKTTSVRSGAATGIGSATTNAPADGVMGIDHFGAYIRGAFEGFALATNDTPKHVLNGTKNYLVWP